MTDFWTTGTLFIKELDILDCAVFCPEHGVIGSSWHVDVEIEGQLDRNGFVYDFSHTKRVIKETLKNSLDHALIIPNAHKSIKIETKNQIASLEIYSKKGAWKYTAPSKSIFQISAQEVTSDTISREAGNIILKDLPSTVSNIKVTLRDENISDEDSLFRYTHGLPFHDGLCQRLLHGHRSKLIIYKDDKRDTEIEKLVIENWFGKNVHIADKSQFKSECWEPYKRGPKDSYTTLSYTSAEGTFTAEIPSNFIFTVEQATSIESISQGICKALKALYPESSFTVIPHEGINKGGIARA